MKLTVCATLLLLLMAGLTLIQATSNTDAAFQALSKAEMLATQGAGQCAVMVDDPDRCPSTTCRSNDTGSYRDYGGSHPVCGDYGSSDDRDCYYGQRNSECGYTQWYMTSWGCISWLASHKELIHTWQINTRPTQTIC